jgi:hypothetical protein
VECVGAELDDRAECLALQDELEFSSLLDWVNSLAAASFTRGMLNELVSIGLDLIHLVKLKMWPEWMIPRICAPCFLD